MPGPIRGTTGERAFDAFVESPTRPNATAVEVVGALSVGGGPFDPPTNSDTITRTVAGAVETYRYRQGGVSGTIIKTVTVTYTNSSLQDLVSVEVT